MADEGFERKLAAILSADVEGYSRLMDDDEEATVRTLTAYRSAISDLVQQYRGRVVDSPGDNILTEFKSVVDAVNCAVEIQRELAERNAELPDNRKMQFRIGVNLGDVIDQDGRIYGDGVNIAARVESLAEAGGICLSGRAHDQVENKLGLEYEDLGKHEVKNISRPIQVYRVLSYPGATAHRVIKAKKTLGKKWLWAVASTIFILSIIFVGLYWKYFYLPAPAEIDPEGKMTFELSSGPSIAVLPFDNMSGDSNQDYFCDGITENIIAALSQTPQLFVVARNSSFAYKGKSIKVQQIGHDLGVQYVLEGSIQKSNERIRITAQLIEAKSGHHLWSDRYDRNLQDIFDLQDEIAIEIMKALQVKLTEGKQIQTRFKDTSNLQVLIKLLRGMQFFRHNTKETMILAQKEADEAIQMDPKNPTAHVLLGAIYIGRLWHRLCESDIVCLGLATEAVQKANHFDEQNSDAQLLKGAIFIMRREHEKAIAATKRAIILNPNNADAYAYLGYYLYLSDRPAEGTEFLKKAIRLNPIPPSFYLHYLGHTYRASNQFQKAVEAYEKSINIQPDNLHAHIGLAATYGLLGLEKKAKASGLEILKIDPEYTIEQLLKVAPLKNQAEVERYSTGLRKAGLPE